MAPSGTESKTLRDLEEEDLDEAVDYETDTDFMILNGSPFTTITGEDGNSRAPSAFLERSAADTPTVLRTSPDVTSSATVNTDLLDEH